MNSEVLQPDERDLDYWFALISEEAAAEFDDCSVRHMQGLRYKGGGPKFIKFGLLVKYRRIDLREDQERRLRSSTADTGQEAEAHAPR